MRKSITLNQFIAELQKRAAVYGEYEFRCVGGCCGNFGGFRSPHGVVLKRPGEVGIGDTTFYIPCYQDELGVHFEVQIFDQRGDDILASEDCETWEKAAAIYKEQKAMGENVRIVKVDKDGYPLEEFWDLD